LSLFVPLCISTGGNSGSQAATLITRAMALGQVVSGDWKRVLRHEVTMGLVLGLTLGAIGFVRASLTPAGVRSSSQPRPEAFVVKVGPNQDLSHRTEVEGWGPWKKTETVVTIPPRLEQSMVEDHPTEVILPEGEELNPPVMDPEGKGGRIYTFPRKCKV